jgi:hypothetical protein
MSFIARDLHLFAFVRLAHWQGTMPAQQRFKPKSEATMAPNRNPKDRPDRSYGANESGHMALQQIQREPATTQGI